MNESIHNLTDVPIGTTVLTDVTYPDQTTKVAFVRVGEDAWLVISDTITEKGYPLTTEKLGREICGPLSEAFWDEYEWHPRQENLLVVRGQILDSYAWKLWTIDAIKELSSTPVDSGPDRV